MPSTAPASSPAPAAAGILACRGELVPGGKGNERRDVDARLVEPRDERFEPRAALDERQLAQILVAVDQQIVGAQVRGKFGEQLGVDALAVEPLLQHVEALHAAVAHDQEFAVDRGGQPQRLDQIGEAPGNILAGAGIEPRHDGAVVARAGHRLHPDAVPFPFGDEVGGLEPGEIFERVREHRGTERRRIAVRRFFGAAFEPGEQFRVGRLESGPDELDLLRVLVAERGGRGLGEPRRDADAQRAGDELEQRPASGLVERVEPVRKLRRQLGLAQRGELFDDLGQRWGVRPRCVQRARCAPLHPFAQRMVGRGRGWGVERC